MILVWRENTKVFFDDSQACDISSLHPYCLDEISTSTCPDIYMVSSKDRRPEMVTFYLVIYIFDSNFQRPYKIL